MKDIQGFEGLYTIDEDGNVFSIRNNKPLKSFLWSSENKQRTYVSFSLTKDGITKNYRLHRLIAKTFIENPENLPCVDHIDRNTMNNRVDNLRWVTHTLNMLNKEKRSIKSTSKYKGVSYDKRNKKWAAYIFVKGRKQKNIGRFDTEEDAARAYNDHVGDFHGEFGYKNVI